MKSQKLQNFSLQMFAFLVRKYTESDPKWLETESKKISNLMSDFLRFHVKQRATQWVFYLDSFEFTRHFL